MVCKQCKSKGFKPTEDMPRPLVNLGKKKFGGVDYRYYMCVMCNFKFVTKEEFEREIIVINKTT